MQKHFTRLLFLPLTIFPKKLTIKEISTETRKGIVKMETGIESRSKTGLKGTGKAWKGLEWTGG